jgi:hypothetical protein
MTRKADEIRLYSALKARKSPYGLADEVFDEVGIHPKRGNAILEKWCDKGWWDYGVSARAGWFTIDSPESLSE